MNIREARESISMTREDLIEWLDIPFRTLQNWENGYRECPSYVEKLIVEKILRDGREYLRGKEKNDI